MDYSAGVRRGMNLEFNFGFVIGWTTSELIFVHKAGIHDKFRVHNSWFIGESDCFISEFGAY